MLSELTPWKDLLAIRGLPFPGPVYRGWEIKESVWLSAVGS